MDEMNSVNRGSPRINAKDLVMVAVSGQIAHPIGAANAYRIGNDGVPRVLPATGGIVINQRIGDRCVGLAGDHIEPGVSLHNNQREVVGSRKGPNQALITYACIGNRVRVTSGPCVGEQGLVTGKHGGVDHVMVDFPTQVLQRLNIGDRMQINSIGLGLELIDYPGITVFNCAPELLQRWGVVERHGRLEVPVTHLIPGRVMGSGLGKNTVWRGDYDIQLFDPAVRNRYGLGRLRFGDMVAIIGADTRFGPSFRQGYISFGIVVHGDSTVSGHGPGVTPLVCGRAEQFKAVQRNTANLADIFGIRNSVIPKDYPKLARRDASNQQNLSRVNRRREVSLADDY
ncbi:MAG: DUF4438 domain-containing protein [Methylococcaceae bacterium]|nr:DUF4438 domain-containing protein [Methylococcaceae bacterium]